MCPKRADRKKDREVTLQFFRDEEDGRDSKRQKIVWNKFVRREERRDREDDYPVSSDELNMVTDFIGGGYTCWRKTTWCV